MLNTKMDLYNLKETILQNIDNMIEYSQNLKNENIQQTNKLNDEIKIHHEANVKLMDEIKEKEKLLNIRDKTINDYTKEIYSLQNLKLEEQESINKVSMVVAKDKEISNLNEKMKFLEIENEKLKLKLSENKNVKQNIVEKIVDEPEIKPEEVKSDEVKSDEVKPEEVKSDEVKSDEEKPNEVKPDDEKLDEVKPIEVKPNDEISDEVKPNEEISDDEEEEKIEFISFNFNNKKYCIKDGLEKPKCYYELNNFKPGEKVGSFKKRKIGGNECYVIQDIEKKCFYRYEINTKTIIGDKIATSKDGKTFKKLKNKN